MPEDTPERAATAETPPAVVARTTDPDSLRTAVAAMTAYAESMNESATLMRDYVKAIDAKFDGVVAALTMKIEGVDAKADATAADVARLAPMRQRAVTLPEILEGTPPVAISQAPTASPAPFLSISPLEAEVSKVSIHAVTNSVPAARKENRWLSVAIAALVVASELIRLLQQHP
jgi:hypothetical protein